MTKTDPELKNMISLIRGWLQGPNGNALWDLMNCTRGPDSPSEYPSQPYRERTRDHQARRARKSDTVAVIRGLVWGPSGGAMLRTDRDYVILPPETEWTHFDKHVARAARSAALLGVKIDVKIKEPLPPPTNEKPVKVITQAMLDAAAEAKQQEKLALLKVNFGAYPTPEHLKPQVKKSFKQYVDFYGKNTIADLKKKIAIWESKTMAGIMVYQVAAECCKIMLAQKLAAQAAVNEVLEEDEEQDVDHKDCDDCGNCMTCGDCTCDTEEPDDIPF